ncbi:hypothetical protein QBC38DRAFT_458633 [Podospora fimiseda]|uniref:C2H2-type domain-containing protein n=1 Tax=Podospora fimiseda TaxID=252190 RepID=A0AAN7GWQ1_9PEZI|nr:hypothetical protein QBC38DRAFT_458633 [Podospora fimiseda]
MPCKLDELPSIQVTARDCGEGFERLLSNTTDTDQDHHLSDIEDQYGRFNLWTSSSAVFAPLQICLDFRLKDIPEATRLIVKHLNILSTRLEQLLELQQVSNQLDAGGWDFDSLMSSVHEAIDWLHRLSNAVRRAGSGIQNQRAVNFLIKDDDGNDITEMVEQLFYRLVKRECEGIEEWFAHRLAQTMLLRRKRILYRRERQRRWTFQQAEREKVVHMDVPVPVKPQPSQKVLVSALVEEPSVEKPVAAEPRMPSRHQEQPVSTTRTYTTPSVALTATVLGEGTAIKLPAPTQSRISRATTAPFQPSERLLVPPYPKTADDSPEFACGYCCLVLPSTIARNSDKWANHIKRDLDPYLCIYDPCPDPLEIYPTSAEWLAHMRTQHRTRWHCPLGEHPDLVAMDTRDQFVNHMQTAHPKSFRADQLASIAETSTHTLDPVITNCPFCTESVDETEETGKTNLQFHVGKHLQYFALLSLPLVEESVDNDEAGPSRWDSNSDGTPNTRSTIRTNTVASTTGSVPSFFRQPYELLSDVPDAYGGPIGIPELSEPVVWDLGNHQRRFSETDQTLEQFAGLQSRKAKAPEIFLDHGNGRFTNLRTDKPSFQGVVTAIVGVKKWQKLAQNNLAEQARYPGSFRAIRFETAVIALVVARRFYTILIGRRHVRLMEIEDRREVANIFERRKASVARFGR